MSNILHHASSRFEYNPIDADQLLSCIARDVRPFKHGGRIWVRLYHYNTRQPMIHAVCEKGVEELIELELVKWEGMVLKPSSLLESEALKLLAQAA